MKNRPAALTLLVTLLGCGGNSPNAPVPVPITNFVRLVSAPGSVVVPPGQTRPAVTFTFDVTSVNAVSGGALGVFFGPTPATISNSCALATAALPNIAAGGITRVTTTAPLVSCTPPFTTTSIGVQFGAGGQAIYTGDIPHTITWTR